MDYSPALAAGSYSCVTLRDSEKSLNRFCVIILNNLLVILWMAVQIRFFLTHSFVAITLKSFWEPEEEKAILLFLF